MRRALLLPAVAALTACATASDSNAGASSASSDATTPPIDAPFGAPPIDAPRPIDAALPDAARPIDAALPIDAPPPIDAPVADTCMSSSTCSAPTTLSPVYGDDGGEATASGYQSAWFLIDVIEDDSGPLAAPMYLTVQLQSPATAMFDLFVYVPGDDTSIDCTTPTGTATTSGTSEVIELEWGETGLLANGDDDSRNVSIEVRPRAGATCAAENPWSLTVVGG